MKVGFKAAMAVHAAAAPDFSTRTYANYIRAIARALRDQYGTDPRTIIADVQRSVPYANPRMKQQLEAIETSLRRAWTCEQMIYTTHDRTRPLRDRAAAISWLATHAYYAIHGALDATLIASGMRTTNHMKALNAYGTTLRAKMPAWVLAVGCAGAEGAWSYSNFRQQPRPCAVLRVAQNEAEYCDHVAVALRKAREEDAQAAIDDWKSRAKRKTIPAAQRLAIVSKRDPTTVLHLFWRLRRRSNYGDIDLFIPEAKRESDLDSYVAAYLQIVAFTVAAFEALVERRIGPKALEAMVRRSPWASAACDDFLSARWALAPHAKP